MTILIPTADTNEEGDTVYVVWNDPGRGDTYTQRAKHYDILSTQHERQTQRVTTKYYT